ncbi:hypothetical protein C8Q73DRAFT_679792 [Cubamyces lactineus]|nr:hypothetical protein C8Q73DRAFT_712317 [Cubamyces lactineus]KAH9899408.1 hypothetical protein C8Q73DRAFT_679792 [Cubamyces lactineus]
MPQISCLTLARHRKNWLQKETRTKERLGRIETGDKSVMDQRPYITSCFVVQTLPFFAFNCRE